MTPEASDETCGTFRILIVDDNPTIHDDFSRILAAKRGDPRTDLLNELEGLLFGPSGSQAMAPEFELDHAHQGAEGVALVEAAGESGRAYSLAFVDIRMPPGIDGVQTVSLMIAADPYLQVVLCTAYSDHTWAELRETFGNTDRVLILKKPFDALEVRQLAHSLARKWELALQMAAHLEHLESAVQARTATLAGLNDRLKAEMAMRAQKTDDVVRILENIEQGIFTLQPDLTLHPEYSVHLEHILGESDLAGKPLMEVLLERSDLGVGRIATVYNTLRVNLGNLAILWDCNAHVLPSEFTFTRPDGDRRLLAVSWIGLANDEDDIGSIMVTIRDITELTALRQRAEHQRQNLLIVGEILALRTQDFERVINTSHGFIDRNLQLIELGDPTAVSEMFRNTHTIKGNASLSGLSKLNDVVHVCEDTYRRLREGAIAWDPDQLRQNEEKIRAVLECYEHEYRVRLAGWGQPSPEIDVEALRSAIAIGEGTGSMDAVLDHLRDQVFIADSVDVWNLLRRPLDNAIRIASERGKTQPNFDLRGDVRVPRILADRIADVFMHVLRNCIDHGIEPPEDRLAANKDAAGTICIAVRTVGDCIEFRVRDDGRGLNVGLLREVYEARHLVAPANTDQAARMIFDSGVSTATSLTDVSGRGVGLDAVRAFLAETGGSVVMVLDDCASVDDEFRGFSLVLTCGSTLAAQSADEPRDLVA